ncbi:hypothetical protein A4X06_0g8351 [Tilletia controversa]|uniref:Tf2-1-like SH3-like domain-containing protein n=2 Tax=Tilletia TaxID=13289 RepID=A0A8X7ST97_9BASI|nr:hypothetical protein CF328_g9364 [Tilletia controversa]KAE8186592.1 hypothetical protein CF336_g6922 [Tilletia laevis]KAE8189758.1 hypothetical protein CF335_g6537 [Tilletia laevis]KAE8239317.1 hypothetical protein A4X06_0g8351 [Tilletia controversa]KAE8245259.1 hypothetical protein A4X03_0g7483 [Tilletia caries]
MEAARAVQKQRYDRRRRPLPVLAVGDLVWVRLSDRPVPGVSTSKLVSKKLGPYPVAEVLSAHRVRLALPSPLRIQAEFAVEQLDPLPTDRDPFASVRARAADVAIDTADNAEVVDGSGDEAVESAQHDDGG